MKVTDGRPIPRNRLALPGFGLGWAQAGGRLKLACRCTLLEQESPPPLRDDGLRHGVAVLAAGPFNPGVQRVKALETVCAEFTVPLPRP